MRAFLLKIIPQDDTKFDSYIKKNINEIAGVNFDEDYEEDLSNGSNDSAIVDIDRTPQDLDNTAIGES